MNLRTRGVRIRKRLCGRCCPPGSQTSWPAQSFEGGHSWSRQSEAPGRCFQTCRLKREKLGLITGIIKWPNVSEFLFQTEHLNSRDGTEVYRKPGADVGPRQREAKGIPMADPLQPWIVDVWWMRLCCVRVVRGRRTLVSASPEEANQRLSDITELLLASARGLCFIPQQIPVSLQSQFQLWFLSLHIREAHLIRPRKCQAYLLQLCLVSE